ncbi:MAG: TIGR00730 family Rossman fold protein, partial [Candidatus Omnitrophica bacterium]|nr:TIGR00730 family Rossman fold protein [Candidatus Omnitrophota bacterium]
MPIDQFFQECKVLIKRVISDINKALSGYSYFIDDVNLTELKRLSRKLDLINKNKFNQLNIFKSYSSYLLVREIADLLVAKRARQFNIKEIKNYKILNHINLNELLSLKIIERFSDSSDYYYWGIPVGSSPISNTHLFRGYSRERNQIKQLFKEFRRVIVFFGSARIGPFKQLYRWTEDLAYHVGKIAKEKGIQAILTGAGPGLMEAVNKGAKRAEINSFGLRIQLPKEEKANSYLDRWIDFRYFFTRKIGFVKRAEAFIVLPGGFGTLNELFEILTLKHRGYIRNVPIILVDSKFYAELKILLKEINRSGFLNRPWDELLCLVDRKVDIIKEVQSLPSASIQRKSIEDKLVYQGLYKALSRLENLGPAVGVVGAHSTPEDSIYWNLAKELAFQL